MDQRLLLCLVLVSCVTLSWGQKRSKCGPCDPSKCPQTRCKAGSLQDSCGCCKICARAEGELCDHPGLKRRYDNKNHGDCGDHLDCRLRKDMAPEDEPQAICQCVLEGQICGSDNNTYDTMCAFLEEQALSAKKLKIFHNGPCKRLPRIYSPPLHAKNSTGSSIALICEAHGFPTPEIGWTWTRVDGKTETLPSDDLHIAVHMRGGPERWQVTGWLQIMDLRKHHEGDYTCIAKNELGATTKSARVNVFDDTDDKEYRRKQRKRERNNLG